VSLKSICVYCGSASKVSDSYKSVARATGTALAAAGKRVVYGGGRVGLMGIVADAALAAGGEVIGIIPHHIQEKEIQHNGLTELHVVDNMHTRKRMMVERADAFVILPGGFGTLDETFEILTWKQLGLHNKPIVFLNYEGYWDHLLALIQHLVTEGFTPADNLQYFSSAASVTAMMTALENAPRSHGDINAKWM
jgi:uncharacterized protein (TIGR00730 family)